LISDSIDNTGLSYTQISDAAWLIKPKKVGIWRMRDGTVLLSMLSLDPLPVVWG